MSVSIDVQGVADIERALDEFTAFGQRGLALSVVRAGLRVIGKQMQADIEPQVQEIKSEVGFRFNRNAGTNVVSGRVGVGVGKVIKKQNVNRGSRGVGINSGNWQWWVLGSFKSGQRVTRRTRANRGVLRPQQPNFAQRAQERANERVRAAMQTALERSMERFFKSK